MLNVCRWYVGDSTPVVKFVTSFPVKCVRIGVEKKTTKKQQKTTKETKTPPLKNHRKSYLPPICLSLSSGFEPTALVHCSSNRLAFMCPTP